MNTVNLVGTLTKDAKIIQGQKTQFLGVTLETPHNFRPADDEGSIRLLVPLYIFSVPEAELHSLKKGDIIAVVNGKVNVESVCLADGATRNETSVKTSWHSVRKL